MKEITKGCFCISRCGHDAGTLYYVVNVSDAAYVCDGVLKGVDNPKKKESEASAGTELQGRSFAGKSNVSDIKE